MRPVVVVFPICLALSLALTAQTTATPSASQINRATPVTTTTTPDSTRLVVTKTVKPVYPPEALRQGLEGEVVIQLSISETGEVESAEQISGDKLLGEAAILAFKNWKFLPYFKDGKAVKVHTKLPMKFDLPTKKPGPAAESPAANAASSTVSDSSEQVSDALASATTVRPTPMVRISQTMSEGYLIYKIAPEYPEIASRAGVHGTVVLRAIIGKDGHIQDLRPISGPSQLFPSAMGAVKQWRYRPYMLNGEPVAVDTQITVNYQPHR